MTDLSFLLSDLQSLYDPDRAKILQRFFKTEKGEYGEGDIFLGIKVPILRKKLKKYNINKFKDIDLLLESKIHEIRLAGLLYLVDRYEKISKYEKRKKNHNFGFEKQDIVKYYLSKIKYINNWDLVDISCHKILGNYLLDKTDRKILYDLSESNNLREKRISIVSTLTFIKNNQFDDTLKISNILMKDGHDLINKAIGWMLREMGNFDRSLLEEFLVLNYDNLSRTTLRYAIEKFPEDIRQNYLKGTF